MGGCVGGVGRLGGDEVDVGCTIRSGARLTDGLLHFARECSMMV